MQICASLHALFTLIIDQIPFFRQKVSVTFKFRTQYKLYLCYKIDDFETNKKLYKFWMQQFFFCIGTNFQNSNCE
jgi:hypothetical protein